MQERKHNETTRPLYRGSCYVDHQKEMEVGGAVGSFQKRMSIRLIFDKTTISMVAVCVNECEWGKKGAGEGKEEGGKEDK